jgi:hypothetical protein
MVYGNPTVAFMVIAVVACALGFVFVGAYYLDKSVDRNDG